jgi:hypothetical protein
MTFIKEIVCTVLGIIGTFFAGLLGGCDTSIAVLLSCRINSAAPDSTSPRPKASIGVTTATPSAQARPMLPSAAG